MSRKPSGRCLANQVDIYHSTIGQDADGGVAVTYPDTPTYTAVECSVQESSSNKQVSDQLRQTMVQSIAVIFPQDMLLKINDKIVYGSRVFFVVNSLEYAGRGSAWEYACEEQS